MVRPAAQRTRRRKSPEGAGAQSLQRRWQMLDAALERAIVALANDDVYVPVIECLATPRVEWKMPHVQPM